MLHWTYSCVYCFSQRAVFTTNKWWNICFESGVHSSRPVTVVRTLLLFVRRGQSEMQWENRITRFQTDASWSTDSNPMLGYFAVPFLPLPLTHVLVAEDHIQNLGPRGGRARFSISCTHSRACTVVFNNNNVQLSCDHQRPERSHDTH